MSYFEVNNIGEDVFWIKKTLRASNGEVTHRSLVYKLDKGGVLERDSIYIKITSIYECKMTLELLEKLGYINNTSNGKSKFDKICEQYNLTATTFLSLNLGYYIVLYMNPTYWDDEWIDFDYTSIIPAQSLIITAELFGKYCDYIGYD